MASRISQREARRWRKRAKAAESTLQAQRGAWWQDWPGGEYIAVIDPTPDVAAAIRTARRLRHAVVVTPSEDGARLRFCALPLAKVLP